MQGLSHPQNPRILVVENNEHHCLLIEEKFRTAFPKAEIVRVRNLSEAVALLPQNSWDLIVLESQLPDGKGTDLIGRLSSRHPFAAVAVLTEDPGREEIPISSHHGAVEFLRKDRETLENLITHARRLMVATQKLQKLVWGGDRSRGGGFRDPLTQVYNRVYFEEALRREVSQANRYGQEFSVLIADVDRFEKINQERGRPAGHRCLKRLASVLHGSVRAGDLVGRYTEDQFILLLSQCRREDGIRCATRVLEKIAKECEEDSFTVSIGIVHYRGSSKVSRPMVSRPMVSRPRVSRPMVSRQEQILSQAHRALASAKRQGGNRYTLAA